MPRSGKKSLQSTSTIEFVTSLSKQGYDQYGKEFFKSYKKYVDKPLHVFSEDKIPEGDFKFHDLNLDTSRMSFIRDFGHMPAANGVIGKKGGKLVGDYRWQAIRFCNKIFAITNRIPKVDWWIWIDADVVWKKKPDKAFWDAVTPNDKLITYIDRNDWGPECGFVAYRVGHPVMVAFLREIRKIYATGEVFALPEWHDSYVFGQLLHGAYHGWDAMFVNLAEKHMDEMHPWPKTILGKYCDHYKGPEAKEERYK